jgi:hypothetical protein
MLHLVAMLLWSVCSAAGGYMLAAVLTLPVGPRQTPGAMLVIWIVASGAIWIVGLVTMGILVL